MENRQKKKFTYWTYIKIYWRLKIKFALISLQDFWDEFKDSVR